MSSFSPLAEPFGVFRTSPFIIGRYLPVILVYFFLNPVGLPHGLLYTSILAPLFYIWLLKKRVRFVLTKFLIALFPFAIVHFINGVDIKHYLVSTLLIFTIYVTVYTFYHGIARLKDLKPHIIDLIHINFALSVIGLILINTPFDFLMWRLNDVITANVDPMKRFQMFVYEPSYYSVLLVPLIFYAYFRFLKQSSGKNLLLLLMVAMPLLMSYSFGVISGIIFVLGVIHATFFKKIFRLNKKFVCMLPFILVVVFCVSLFTGTFSQRLMNFLSGVDTSGEARTSLSLLFAFKIAKLKSLYWGAGLGQSKLLGVDIIAPINSFWAENGARLFSSVADTIATFGFIGIFFKLAFEIILFVRTKVYVNYYRLALFLFMFVYQFTGSFLTNLAEYVIWALAFSNVLSEFDIVNSNKVQLHKAAVSAGASQQHHRDLCP